MKAALIDFYITHKYYFTYSGVFVISYEYCSVPLCMNLMLLHALNLVALINF